MMTLRDLPAPALHLLKKLITDECKDRRDSLGTLKAEYEVDQTVVLHVDGTVRVAKSSPDAIIAQKAKPFALLAVALQEANKQLEAAGLVGIDLKKVVEMAENVDSELVKKAEKAAKAHLKAIKEETRGFKYGAVSCEGTCDVPAQGDHRFVVVTADALKTEEATEVA